MALKTIYISRHGYNSAWNNYQDEDEEMLDPPTGIPDDTQLSSQGVLQSKELAHYLISLDTQPDLVLSSPYYRCVESANFISQLLDIPLLTDKGLGEWFDNEVKVDVTSATGFVYQRHREVHPPSDVETLNKLFKNRIKSEWKDCVDPYTEDLVKAHGESQEEMYERTRSFLQIMTTQVEKYMPDVETILFMTHAPIKVSLGLNLLGFPDIKSISDNLKDVTAIKNGCCSLDKYELDDHNLNDNDPINNNPEYLNNNKSVLDYKWKITMNGNTIFLRNGDEMSWPFKNFIKRIHKLDDESNGVKAEEFESYDDEEDTNEETETIYVSLDLNSGFYKDRLSVEKNAIFQYSGLNQDKPLFRIGNKLYEGEWSQLVGTELAFPNEAAVRKRNKTVTDVNQHGIEEEEEEEEEDDDDDDDDDHIPVHLEEPETAEQTSHEKPEFDDHNLDIDTTEYGEVIYRIKERLVLSGLHPVQ